MSHIFRYVSVVASATAHQHQSAPAAPADTHQAGSENSCNYRDNYYGDRVCSAKSGS